MPEARAVSSRNRDLSGPLQLYVHVPFCEKKCHYCDFASWELPAVQQRRWTETILRELTLRAPDAEGRAVATVFFGGGTPSLLAPEFLEIIAARLRSDYDLSGVKEITIECNPSSLNREKLDLYRRLGFTRVSLGIQSFHASELSLLGRVHTVQTARQALETVAADGRFEFSGDLIFGVPGQTRESFSESLGTLLDYKPDHVSFYGLTVEAGTEFARRKAMGTLSLPEDSLYNGMYLDGVDRLARAGYGRYEVSNFSLPGRECRHNQGYWDGTEYLGFGPGAHSYWDGVRTVAPSAFEDYLAWGEGGFDAAGCEREVLTSENLLAEAFSLGLRQGRGVDLPDVEGRFGFVPAASSLGKWIAAGMLERNGSRVNLIGDGWLFLDEIAADVLARGRTKE